MKKYQHNFITILGVLLSICAFAGPEEGRKIFQQRCESCHSVGKGKIVGPDLKNVSERRDQKWILSFIKSPAAAIKSGDGTAKKLFEESGKVLMPDQNLTDENIISLLDYIKAEGEKAENRPEENEKTKNTSEISTASQSENQWDYVTYSLILFCILLCSVIITMLIKVDRLMRSSGGENGRTGSKN